MLCHPNLLTVCWPNRRHRHRLRTPRLLEPTLHPQWLSRSGGTWSRSELRLRQHHQLRRLQYDPDWQLNRQHRPTVREPLHCEKRSKLFRYREQCHFGTIYGGLLLWSGDHGNGRDGWGGRLCDLWWADGWFVWCQGQHACCVCESFLRQVPTNEYRARVGRYYGI